MSYDTVVRDALAPQRWIEIRLVRPDAPSLPSQWVVARAPLVLADLRVHAVIVATTPALHRAMSTYLEELRYLLRE